MVGVVSGSLHKQTHSLSCLAWSEGRRPFGAILHSSNEPGELSQWLCHDDSTRNIVLVIIIIIIIVLLLSLTDFLLVLDIASAFVMLIGGKVDARCSAIVCVHGVSVREYIRGHLDLLLHREM